MGGGKVGIEIAQYGGGGMGDRVKFDSGTDLTIVACGPSPCIGPTEKKYNKTRKLGGQNFV